MFILSRRLTFTVGRHTFNKDAVSVQEGGGTGSLVGASSSSQTQNVDATEVEDRGAANYNAQVPFSSRDLNNSIGPLEPLSSSGHLSHCLAFVKPLVSQRFSI